MEITKAEAKDGIALITTEQGDLFQVAIDEDGAPVIKLMLRNSRRVSLADELRPDHDTLDKPMTI